MLSELRVYPTLFFLTLPFQRNGLGRRFTKSRHPKGGGLPSAARPLSGAYFGSRRQAIPLKWQSL